MKGNILEKKRNILKLWYLLLITGIIHLILGITALIYPLQSFVMLSIFLSFGIMLSGIVEIAYAINNRDTFNRWGWYLVGGGFNFIMGIILISNPSLSAIMLTVFMGVWLFFRSIFNIVIAFQIKKSKGEDWGWALILGVIGLLFSQLLLWNPDLLGVAVGIWIGLGLISIGSSRISISMFLRRIRKMQLNIREKIKD